MLALLCGGQGLLSADMFDLVADQPEAATVFDAARRLLGGDPRDLVRGNDHEGLIANRPSQILSVASALAVYACIKDALPARVAVAGYSVGEMAAWSVAGIWTAETALALTDKRARAMDHAGGTDGRLGYVRGLRRQAVEGLVRRHDCAIAILNPGNLFVVGGSEAGVSALCETALVEGATRCGLLGVKIASHTPRLSEAVAPFRHALEAATASVPAPNLQLFAGGNGERIVSTAATASLAAQVAAPIDWATTLEMLAEAGVDQVLDLGPGHALAEMAREAMPDARSYAVTAFHSIDGCRRWLASR